MFTIAYANGCRVWSIPKHKLQEYIVTSQVDIADIYEQATPVTKRIRKELLTALDSGRLDNATPAARRFITNPA